MFDRVLNTSLSTYGYVKKYLGGISAERNSPGGFSEGNLMGENVAVWIFFESEGN